DLSGGQAIGALVARHYQVPREQLTMWDFSDIDAPKRVKDAYRAHLDEITDPAVREEFLAQTKLGYELAGELFTALERCAHGTGPAGWRTGGATSAGDGRRLPCDRELLVGGHHHHRDRGLRGGDDRQPAS